MTLSQPAVSEPSPVRMVDLFAGPGGLDVAAHWLGISVIGIEWDEDACATRLDAGLETVQKDVRRRSPGYFRDASMLAGGPPCQTYTVAGTGSGRKALDQVLHFVRRMGDGEKITEDVERLDDVRTGLVLEPLRWALAADRRGYPYSTIVLEQVPAVLPVWKEIARVLESIGYHTATGLLHAEEFGVPQTRRRAILLAARDHPVELPRPTHRRYRKGIGQREGDPTLLPWKSMGETLPDRGPFEVVSNYGTGGNPQLRGRRKFDEPAATVTGKVSRNRLIVPADSNHLVSADPDNELERFSLTEAGLLQTFPIDYPWSGRNVAQQIGNAIPPRLAAHVLAAALGGELEDPFLDEVVVGKWAETREGAPLARGFRKVSRCTSDGDLAGDQCTDLATV
ncbi:DNA cytosine methyltransferase [Kocuria sp. CPCC 205263]|uniref:DNA cytosine methyltransferase n=1 Tax=Kocuria sp. CPCC 205263 TaxID=3073555 RepID=UPI0034D6F3BF